MILENVSYTTSKIIDKITFNTVDNYLLLIKGLIRSLIIILYLYLKIYLLLFRLNVLQSLKAILSFYFLLIKKRRNSR